MILHITCNSSQCWETDVDESIIADDLTAERKKKKEKTQTHENKIMSHTELPAVVNTGKLTLSKSLFLLIELQNEKIKRKKQTNQKKSYKDLPTIANAGKLRFTRARLLSI